MFFCEREQVHVGHLTVSHRDRRQPNGRSDRKVIGPEDMTRQRYESVKERDGFTRSDGVRCKRRIRRDPDETRLRQRTGAERLLSPGREPLEYGGVMEMIRPCEREQNVRIEQVGLHNSSSRANVCSSVMGAASTGTEKHGIP